MLLGFGIAPVFQAPAPVRDKRLLLAGATATAAFIALRLSALYGDPNPWTMQPTAVATLVDLLNVTKYPPSLLFALMTLGPAFMVCSVADRLPSWLVGPLVTFGRVPFAFYVAHLYLIHAIALLIGLSQGFAARQFLTFGFLFPKGFGFGLPGVYLVWALVVLVLYPFCRWVAAVKARRRDWWLSYL